MIFGQRKSAMSDVVDSADEVFGLRMKEARGNRSQADLAKELSVPLTTYGRYE